MSEEFNERVAGLGLLLRPGIHTDPAWMEYALQDSELEANVKSRLLASQFNTIAAVHSAIAEGASDAARIIAGSADQ
jgi:hypothetical protein